MSFTNDIETKILKKLTGLEKTGSSSPQAGTAWAKPSAVAGGQPSSAANNKLHLKAFTSSPGETGSLDGVVSTNLFLMPFSQIEIKKQSAVFTPQFPNPLPTSSDEWQFFSFFPGSTDYQETAAEVTSIAVCDSNNSVIWFENLVGSAVRKYRSIDELRLTSVTFGLTGSAICKDLASYVLKHIFSSATADFMPELNTTYLTFYDGDPGFDGTGASEQGTRYPMGATNQDTGNTWTVENGTASNNTTIRAQFTQAASVTHVALRSADTGGEIYWRGPLLSPQKLAPSDTLAILPGQLALSID